MRRLRHAAAISAGQRGCLACTEVRCTAIACSNGRTIMPRSADWPDSPRPDRTLGKAAAPRAATRGGIGLEYAASPWSRHSPPPAVCLRIPADGGKTQQPTASPRHRAPCSTPMRPWRCGSPPPTPSAPRRSMPWPMCATPTARRSLHLLPAQVGVVSRNPRIFRHGRETRTGAG